MFKAILAALLAVTLQTAAWAACFGTDYRTAMPPAQLGALREQVAQVPFAYGNHWIATKGSKTIHVIGTFHGGDSRMARVMRGLRPVIDTADAVLFEVTGPALKKHEQYPGNAVQYLMLPPGRSLQQLVSREAWESLALLSSAAGLAYEEVGRMQPWFASHLLVGTGCIPYGFGIARGLDERIERYAIRKRIPIGSLETVGSGYQAFARVPLRDQARMLEFELKLAQSGLPPNATPLESYFDEATWESLVLERQIMKRAVTVPPSQVDRQWDLFEENVIYRRNRHWMKPLLAAPGDTIVAAVGAAHLPGHQGVLNLLKSKGFTLTRAPW